MKNKILLTALFVGLFLTFSSCSSDNPEVEPYLIVKFKFDQNQARLNNLGQPSTIPSANRTQTPIFNSISAHYFELAPTAFTALGNGSILYKAPETTIGSANAIDFSQSKIVAEGETFLKIPLKQLAAGSYQYVRVSLSYQNYQIAIRSSGVDYNGTLASFVGFNTYITTHSIGNAIFPVNSNKAQGYWALNVNGLPFSGNGAGVTTVPNPLFATSPIPAGSCVVTGKFTNDLVISGKEERDVTVTLSLSINNSFEWQENTVPADNKFEPGAIPTGDVVVDMGLRGLIPSYTK